MYIQSYSDTNFRGLLDDLDEQFGYFLDIGYDDTTSRIYPTEEMLEQPEFYELINDYGAELISN